MAELWQVAKVGRPPRFREPDELWKEFVSYCEWAGSNPVSPTFETDDEDGDKGKRRRRRARHLRRPLTLYGFCAYANIPKWGDFKAAYRGKEGFSEVITRVENITVASQVEGAVLRIYDSSIVARLNGINDSIDIKGDISALFRKQPPLSDEEIRWLDEHRNG